MSDTNNGMTASSWSIQDTPMLQLDTLRLKEPRFCMLCCLDSSTQETVVCKVVDLHQQSLDEAIYQGKDWLSDTVASQFLDESLYCINLLTSIEGCNKVFYGEDEFQLTAAPGCCISLSDLAFAAYGF
ncbi:hypothetical protein DPMN_067495 [Dreissena polymorpha]|uniref:Uncharacterized protein n=1 Tax=Dreissena polymorpha TaxID=45954 RepID=A0A9D3YZB2_DREPO|nr:hypothetical protein DPMN_067495 [Dreissena polymorpha]